MISISKEMYVFKNSEYINELIISKPSSNHTYSKQLFPVINIVVEYNEYGLLVCSIIECCRQRFFTGLTIDLIPSIHHNYQRKTLNKNKVARNNLY